MSRKIIGIIAALFVTAAGLVSPLSTIKAEAASDWPCDVYADAASAIVMEQETGTVLYEKKADVQHYPASITKILTALVALENSSLDEIVTFSPLAVSQSAGGTSSIWRDVGEEMTMEQCLYGMMLESANECAWAIGEHVGGGDIEVFLDMMNEKAKELGCENSDFHNPNGLPDEKHLTTARDMALISRAAYANPEFAKITGTKTYVIPPTNKHEDNTYCCNHHCMLNYYKTGQYIYDYCVGGKTGYTVAAGSTLVTYAQKDGMTLVVVVMKAIKPQHWDDTRRLCDYFFDHYEVKKASELVDFIPEHSDLEAGGLSDTGDALVRVDDNAVVILPKKAKKKNLKQEIVSETTDPEAIGTVKFTYGKRPVGEAWIYAEENSVRQYPFHNMSEDGSPQDYIHINFPMIVVCAVGVIVILAIIPILIRLLRREMKKKRRKRYELEKDQPKYTAIKDNSRRRKR